MKPKINIAIDGYSSCGKSTLARSVARELNYIYIDSGAMYRAVALFALHQGYIKPDGIIDEDGLVKALDLVLINFKYNTDAGQNETYLNGVNVEREIRSIQVSNYVSIISNIKEVRAKLVRLQKRIAEGKGVVMDGRDIGTVVIPDAELKFFMTAEIRIRAQRRYFELKSMGVETTVDEVLANISSRDEFDSTRANDPLKQATDAIVIDNSNLTIEEQFQFVMGQILKKIGLLEGVD
ncbi:MAG: (d)CMP kinase [Crocinitomicaceae bacterium]|nr:(d)CMP kinase [Crocinitomicaceae bacterium]